MAKTQEQMDRERIEDVANVARSEASKDAFGQVTSGMWGGIAKGISAGASIGAVGGLPGMIAGALVGGAIGGIGGGASAYGKEMEERKEFDKQAREAEKQRQEQAKETAKLQRQMTTTSQQVGRARSAEGASTIKQPTLSTPAGEDIAMAAMPVASRRGTQYDAWRQQTYGS